MSTTTTPNGFPYPNGDEPVANMDLSIKALAEAVDPWACMVSKTGAAQVLATGATVTITFDTEDSDVHNQFVVGTSNTNIVVGAAGLYTVRALCGFAASAAGQRQLGIYVNGVQKLVVQEAPSPAGTSVHSIAGDLKLAAGDVVTLRVSQASGGNLNTASVPRLSISRYAPVG